MRIVLPLRVDPEHAPARQQQSGQDPPNELPIQPPRPHPPAPDLQAPICQAASKRTSEPSTRSLKTGRTSCRLRARIASRQVFPSTSIRRVTYALAGGWNRDWVTAITCMARLSWRLPPRLSRIRWTCPELAGIGATPAR